MPPLAALAVGVTCISLSGIFVKLAQVPGPTSAFYRFAIAAAVLLPIWLYRQRGLPARWKLTALGGGFFALDLALWNTSLLLIPAATSTLLANCAPLFVALGTVLLFKRALSGKFPTSLALTMIGMAIVVGPEALSELSASRGVALGIAAAAAYAAYLLITERERKQLDTLTFMTISSVAATVLLGVYGAFAGLPFTGFSVKSWSALAGLGLISHLCGWLAINHALGHLPASTASIVLLGQVALTALIAWPVLGEPIGWRLLLGGALVLGGIVLITRARASESSVDR
jgi:drug/metabolite transporter (DMT)-like permease